MNIQERIINLFTDPRLADELDEYNLGDEIEDLAEEIGWEPVIESLIQILEDTSLIEHWFDAVGCVYTVVSFAEEVPCDQNYLIALLCDCLLREPDLGRDLTKLNETSRMTHSPDNTIWSIIIKLKRIDYMSDYAPMDDPDILKQQIRR